MKYKKHVWNTQYIIGTVLGSEPNKQNKLKTCPFTTYIVVRNNSGIMETITIISGGVKCYQKIVIKAIKHWVL